MPFLGDYDEQSTPGRRNDVPLRYVQPTLEPVYIDPRFSNPEIHVLTYPSKPNIQHSTSTPLIPQMPPITPYYRSLTPVAPNKGYLPSVQPGTMEYFPHRYSTPSEDLNHAFVPPRRISGASVGQQVMSGYTMMHVPQTGHDSLHSSPGLGRRQSECSSLLHAGTMPAQSLPKNEVSQ